jgi:hypothetical protein
MEPKTISYEFAEGINSDMPGNIWSALQEMSTGYEKDINGIDLGFNGLISITNHAFLINHSTPAGFILGKDSFYPQFPGEKSFCPVAAYLKPEYRNKAGQHKDVMKNALEALVDTLEQRGFDRFNIIPDCPGSHGLVTNAGEKQILQPLFYMLQARAKAKTAPGTANDDEASAYFINSGSNPIKGDFSPRYLFNPKSFYEKARRAQAARTVGA